MTTASFVQSWDATPEQHPAKVPSAADGPPSSRAPADYERIYAEELPRLRRIASALGTRWHTADDVLQDTFVALRENCHILRDAEHARRWLWRVTVNRCLLALRRIRTLSAKRARLGQRVEASEAIAHARPGAERVSTEDVRVVRAALDGLNEEDSIMLVLRYYCDLNATQIGELLQVSPATVRGRLSRARLALAEQLVERGLDHHE